MLPNNLAISIIDVLNFHQRREKVFVRARTYSAIILRLKTPRNTSVKTKRSFLNPEAFVLFRRGLLKVTRVIRTCF